MRKTTTAVAALALAGLLATVVLAGTVNGTAKNDVLRGTGKADTMNGKAGNDKMYGLGGNDKLVGGPGNDLLVGGPGKDDLNCGPGKDSAQADDSDKVSPSCESVKGVTPPAVSIEDASVAEGNAGTTTISFSLTLSKPATNTASVGWATANGTATTPSVYQDTSGKMVFTPGQTSKTISVGVRGDTVYESDENFTINLSEPENLTIADGSAVGTIRNDDPVAPPGHYSGKTSQNETFDFDVNSSGSGLTGLKTGQINQSCSPPAYVSGGRLDFGSNTYPIGT